MMDDFLMNNFLFNKIVETIDRMAYRHWFLGQANVLSLADMNSKQNLVWHNSKNSLENISLTYSAGVSDANDRLLF